MLLLGVLTITAAGRTVVEWTFDKPGDLQGWQPNEQLKNVVQGEGIELFVIGDALVPRNLSSAVHDGFRIGVRI